MVTVTLHIVPKASPNADARKIEVQISEQEDRALRLTRRITDSWPILEPHVPADHFLVRYDQPKG